MIVSDEIHFSIEDTYHGLRQILTNDKYYFVFWFRLYHPFRWNTFVYRRSHRLRQQRQTTNMNLYHRSGYVIDSDEIHLSIEDVYHCLRQMRQMKNAIFSFKTHHLLWWSVLVYRRCVSLFSTNIVKWQMLFFHSEYIIDYDEIHLSKMCIIVCDNKDKRQILYSRSKYIIDCDDIHLSIEDVYHRLRQMWTKDRCYILVPSHHSQLTEHGSA